MSEAALEEEAEAANDRAMNAAFTAWLMGAGKGTSFKKFCEDLGLMKSDTPKTEEERKAKAAKILEEHMRRKNGQNSI